MPVDDGHAVHYTALERGIPVYSSDEVQVGKVAEVLDNYREHIFDGLVIELSDGERRFVDAPEVARTAERGRGEAVGEREIDLNAIAAPITGPGDELLAILGLQGPAGRFNRRALRAALPRLLESAADLSTRSRD